MAVGAYPGAFYFVGVTEGIFCCLRKARGGAVQGRGGQGTVGQGLTLSHTIRALPALLTAAQRLSIQFGAPPPADHDHAAPDAPSPVPSLSFWVPSSPSHCRAVAQASLSDCGSSPRLVESSSHKQTSVDTVVGADWQMQKHRQRRTWRQQHNHRCKHRCRPRQRQQHGQHH